MGLVWEIETFVNCSDMCNLIAARCGCRGDIKGVLLVDSDQSAMRSGHGCLWGSEGVTFWDLGKHINGRAVGEFLYHG
jgi:hypothetical protein